MYVLATQCNRILGKEILTAETSYEVSLAIEIVEGVAGEVPSPELMESWGIDTEIFNLSLTRRRAGLY